MQHRANNKRYEYQIMNTRQVLMWHTECKIAQAGYTALSYVSCSPLGSPFLAAALAPPVVVTHSHRLSCPAHASLAESIVCHVLAPGKGEAAALSTDPWEVKDVYV